MDNKYEFKDKNGKILIFKLYNNKITFNCETKDIVKNKFKYEYTFTKNDFINIFNTLLDMCTEKWKKLTLKKVYSLCNDYEDMYDKDFDNNCSITLNKHTFSLKFNKPDCDEDRLVWLTKPYTESFLYDYKNIVDQLKYDGGGK